MIHVCYVLHDDDGRYSKFTGTSMASIFENVTASPVSVCIHIIHDNTLTDDNRDKFSYIAGRYGQEIKFYNVEKICVSEIASIKKIFKAEQDRDRFSIGKFFKLLTPYVLSEEIGKVIYLDSDIILHMDITELWNVEIDNKPLAAVTELSKGIKEDNDQLVLVHEGYVNMEDYFNSGVMVLNLKHIRDKELENIWQGILFRSKHPQCILYDQECLNYIFAKRYLKLPPKFNTYPNFAKPARKDEVERILYHYAGKVLELNFNNKYNRLWFSYFEKTPWFNKDALAHLHEGIIQLHVGLKNFASQVTAVMSGKKRAFFVIAQNIEVMKKTLYIKDDEEIIPAVDQESLQLLINSMKNSGTQKVYFIFVGAAYEGVRFELTKAGFVEGKDFIDISNFLSEIHGVPLNTYYLVRSL